MRLFFTVAFFIIVAIVLAYAFLQAGFNFEKTNHVVWVSPVKDTVYIHDTVFIIGTIRLDSNMIK